MTIHQTTFEADKTATTVTPADETSSPTTIIGVLRGLIARCGRIFWGYTEAHEKTDTSSYKGIL